MRQSIRALGWSVTISTLVLFLFLLTAFYSVFQTVLIRQGIGLGDLRLSFSDETLILSMPVTVNNTGYYDIGDFTITTTLKDSDGAVLVEQSTVIREIKTGHAGSSLHNLSLSLEDILANRTYLLFQDAEFNMSLSAGFKYAHALGFHITIANMSMPWGAPLYGLVLRGVGSPTFNGTHLLLYVVLEFENHSPLDVAGILHLRVYNEADGQIGEGTGQVHVSPEERLGEPILAVIQIADPTDFTGKGYVEVSLELLEVDHIIELGRADYG